MKNILLTILLLSSTAAAQRTVEIKGAPHFDVKISTPKCKEDTCLEKTTYSLVRKGQKDVFQNIEIEMDCLDGDGEEPETSSEDYEDQFRVLFGDYNFDGFDDLALFEGMNGGYGSPTYQIYLFSNSANEFIPDSAFSELTHLLGMFQIDKRNKLLYVYSKSGCCWHQTEGYMVAAGKLIKVYVHTEDALNPTKPGDADVTSKKLINGKWRTWGRSSAAPVYFEKGKSSKTLSARLSKAEPIKWFKIRAAKGQILTATVDSPDAGIEIVDYKGDLEWGDNYEIQEEADVLTAKLKSSGDYYLELRAETEVDVNLTIRIRNDDPNTAVSNSEVKTINTRFVNDSKNEIDKTAGPGVVILGIDSGSVLGGYKDGTFVDAKTVSADFVPDQDFNLYGLGSISGKFKVPAIEYDDRCEIYYFESKNEDKTGIALSPNAGWNPVPRESRIIDNNNKAYVDVVRKFLQSKGIARPVVKIRQIVKTDLEGDGQDEVLIYANNVPDGRMSPGGGDYSFLLLRKIVNGKAKNIVLGSEIYAKGKRIMMWTAPIFKVISILDLNGDGTMEIAFYETGYEYASTTVYQVKDGNVLKVLETGCGA